MFTVIVCALFLKYSKNFYYLCVWVLHVCLCTTYLPGAHRGVRSLGFRLGTEIGFHVGAGNQTEFAGRTLSALNLSHLSSPFYILKCHTSKFRHLMVQCGQLYCVCVSLHL